MKQLTDCTYHRFDAELDTVLHVTRKLTRQAGPVPEKKHCVAHDSFSDKACMAL